jgi:hypothetical protein
MTENTPLTSNPLVDQHLSQLPPEFDEAGKHQMREKARRGLPEAFAEMSDEWIADRVRMLLRNDIWHEAICTAGRDRIMRLSLEVERLRAALCEIASADPSPGQLEKWCNWVHCKARDALAGVPDETPHPPSSPLLAAASNLMTYLDGGDGANTWKAIGMEVDRAVHGHSWSRQALIGRLRAAVSNARAAVETSASQAPIAKVTVTDGDLATVELYAPGLPPGEHDLFCEPEATAPYMRANETAAAPFNELMRAAHAALDVDVWQPGQFPGFTHILYCRYCHYSQEHGHGKDCILKQLEWHFTRSAVKANGDPV